MERALKRPGAPSDGAAAAARRREEERAPVQRRRGGRRTGRTEQLNLKVRPEFRRRVFALADAAGLLVVEYIEAAVDLKVKHDNR